MNIAELFRRPIDRRIEEVIKVDLGEEAIVAEELDEYVVTEHIRESFETVLERYQETIGNPDEGTNVWVSGFFGSGKSSFAKVLGYLLANPTVDGRPAVDRFNARVDSPTVVALLNTIHARSKTIGVFVDLSTSKDVLHEGESVVLPLYRTLLERLGYSKNVLLAELEFDLETDGDLPAFEEAFDGLPGGRGRWRERRNVGLARSEASHALHLLRPETYPHADSWARGTAEPAVTANWFADRATELLRRRGEGAGRLAFVVDEVGQYVARSVARMLDLQGLAEAVQKKRGGLWLVVTSQETLADVIEGLEGKQIELARVQARFPVRVDLLPEDIDEVVAKRVLEKNDLGGKAVLAAYGPHRHQLANSVRLSSPRRAEDLAAEKFVRLYPLLPYQVQLLIDAVSARRAQGGGSPVLGGSNRTLIKLAQQLVVHPRWGLAGEEVGALVTLDRAYELLGSIIPTAWQDEVGQVEARFGEGSLESHVAKVVALCVDVPALPLDPQNVAALLHPAIGAESRRAAVTEALERLTREEALRRSDDGYRLQSPQEKSWEHARRGIDPKPAESVRIRRQSIRAALSGLSADAGGRTFKVQVTVEGEKVLDGDIPLFVDEAKSAARDEIRERSREQAAESMIWWVYEVSPETDEAITELHRSQQMIARRDTAGKSGPELELVGEERRRQADAERILASRLGADLLAGQVFFKGQMDDVPHAEAPRVAGKALVGARVGEIYPRLKAFSARAKREDAQVILRSDDLRGLPDDLGEDGIGLVRLTPDGVRLVTEEDPLAAVLGEIRRRSQYGNETTGAHLERLFGAPPYGAPVELVQVLVAAGIRAGLVEVVYQGARIARADDARLEKVFGTLPSFRAASFEPQAVELDLATRAKVAQGLEDLIGRRPDLAAEALAGEVRTAFLPDGDVMARVSSALRALGLPVPDAVGRAAAIVARLGDASDNDVVRSAANTWEDLVAGRQLARRLATIVDDDMEVLRLAKVQVSLGAQGLDYDLIAAQETLQDILGAGDLADHMAEVRDISARLAAARRSAAAVKLAELGERVTEEVAALRTRYESQVAKEVLAEALRPLASLVPEEGESHAPGVHELELSLAAVHDRAEKARVALADLTEPDVVRLRVGGLYTEPIASEEELEVALERIREAAAAELGEGRKVQLV